MHIFFLVLEFLIGIAGMMLFTYTIGLLGQALENSTISKSNPFVDAIWGLVFCILGAAVVLVSGGACGYTISRYLHYPQLILAIGCIILIGFIGNLTANKLEELTQRR